MMKKQLDTLYTLKYRIEAERQKCNAHSYEYEQLGKEEAALSCAIFELENPCQNVFIKGEDDNKEICKMLTLSTAHISKDTVNWLSRKPDVVAYKKSEYGWFIYVE